VLNAYYFRKCFVVFSLCIFVTGSITDKNDDDVYVDNTAIIVASSVIGAVAFIVLVFVFQFVRYENQNPIYSLVLNLSRFDIISANIASLVVA